MRQLVAVFVLGVCGVLAAAGGGAAAPQNSGCPPPFSATSFTAAVAQIQSQGYTGDVAPFLAFLEQTDMNNDQVVCVKDIPNTPGNQPWQNIYIDNVAAA